MNQSSSSHDQPSPQRKHWEFDDPQYFDEEYEDSQEQITNKKPMPSKKQQIIRLLGKPRHYED